MRTARRQDVADDVRALAAQLARGAAGHIAHRPRGAHDALARFGGNVVVAVECAGDGCNGEFQTLGDIADGHGWHSFSKTFWELVPI